jgi:hypothetical protein
MAKIMEYFVTCASHRFTSFIITYFEPEVLTLIEKSKSRWKFYRPSHPTLLKFFLLKVCILDMNRRLILEQYLPRFGICDLAGGFIYLAKDKGGVHGHP